MLISKIPVGSIMVFKLSNSDEVIAKIVEYDDKDFIVESAFVLIMGQKGMQFSPMLIMAEPDSKVTINRSNIVARCPPSKTMLGAYEQATSAIVLPSKQGIIM